MIRRAHVKPTRLFDRLGNVLLVTMGFCFLIALLLGIGWSLRSKMSMEDMPDYEHSVIEEERVRLKRTFTE